MDSDDENLQQVIDGTIDIDNLDIKGPEFQAFRHHFRKQFDSYQEYQNQLRLLQSRPELIPHFLIQYKKIQQQNKFQRKLREKATKNEQLNLLDLSTDKPQMVKTPRGSSRLDVS